MSENQKVDRRDFLRVGAGAAIGSAALALLGPPPAAEAAAGHVRWDIIHVNFSTNVVSAGGSASARANDNSKITLTGSGTFVDSGGPNASAKGGGTWQTFSPAGGLTGSGTYDAERIVHFEVAPGTFNPALADAIGNRADASAGLAVLQIAYSDGSEGVLVVSCTLGATSPPSTFEGITATKGFVDYWSRNNPVAGVDADRTLFHVT